MILLSNLQFNMYFKQGWSKHIMLVWLNYKKSYELKYTKNKK